MFKRIVAGAALALALMGFTAVPAGAVSLGGFSPMCATCETPTGN